ncbi:hypothetical protein LTR59_001306 [Friedmanniomyces endolithicus]|nr:hypothetical protein LTR94_003403 [Friedmanniomyces endolithicus]KAK0812929.1 hypothetical protein LTR59_001306 [Friedmanniomyces endolithicus]KAK0820180.1 hypothetical protein LTR38_000088 [Friedmanniomyces endolithicus]
MGSPDGISFSLRSGVVEPRETAAYPKIVCYALGKIIYTLYIHPLAKVPGPKLNALTRVPYVRHLLAGTTVDNVSRLHDKYGDVVRVSPNEVSCISGDAWQDIYGFRTGKLKGHLNMQKDPAWYVKPSNGVPSILLANDADHTRGRRILAHAFSEKALAEQEPVVQDYVDQLVSRLKEVTSKSSEPVDMVAWYNWTTFDIISALLWGEPFGSLQDMATHKYIHVLLDSVKSFSMFYIMSYWPVTKYLGNLIIDQKIMAGRREYLGWITSQTKKRVERETQRPDFMTAILKHNGEKGEVPLSMEEMVSNSVLMISAGSETTATMLSATTFQLLKNPAVMQKLKDEIRGRWTSYSDITLEEVNKAPYLLAVLSEGLRYQPPVPAGFERKVVVSGFYLPWGTSVSVSQFPAYHSAQNFSDPETFAPERWMDNPKYANDTKHAFQPFSFGPRNCLGKNLAYAEMRLIMAKMIWSFELELDPRSANWMDECLVKTLWIKPELKVRVREVVRT